MIFKDKEPYTCRVIKMEIRVMLKAIKGEMNETL